jgi:phage terminase Nu1 subunit (DNA packaging protein)
MNKALTTAELMALEVSSRTLGQILGADQRTIERYGSDGLAVRVGHGRYLLTPTVRNVVKRLREQAAGRIGHDESVDVVRANARFKDAQTRLTDIKIKQLEGELISLPEVEAAWDEVAATIKQLFLTFPVRARADLPHLTGTDQKLLYKLAREMLTEVATEGRVRLPPSATSRQCEAKIGAGR